MNFRQLRRPEVSINLTPLIDVVFLLLIFFVVPATFDSKANLIVDLPTTEGRSVADQEKTTLTLVIRKDSSFYFDQELLFFENVRELSSLISLKLGGLSPSDLVIAADELAPHKSVVLAIDAARISGFERVFLKASYEGKVSP